MTFWKHTLWSAALLTVTMPVYAEEISVNSADALRNALKNAQPGQTIVLQPGTYEGAFGVRAGIEGTADQPIIITAAEGPGTATLDGAGANITMRFTGTSHIIMRDLAITGGGYHGVFFDQGTHDVTLENNRIHDNTRVQPMDSHAEVKGSGGNDETRPRRITLRGNTIFHTQSLPGGNFQGIDCNRCDDFHIVGNHIHSINQPTRRIYSYYDQGACIQMKTRSRGTIIEGNHIENCYIGIVYGGEGAESPEHIGGIVRNNVIVNNENIGLVIANVDDGKVFNNTFYGNYRDVLLGSDRAHHRPRNDVIIANNVMERPVEELVFKGAVLNNNVLVADNTVFVNPERGDFRLLPGAVALIDQGMALGEDMPDDLDGTLRPQGDKMDVGAFEFVLKKAE